MRRESVEMNDYTTKFQSQFDLYAALKNDIGASEEDAQYIVKAVQEYEKLREALKKCDPEDWSGPYYCCMFCRQFKRHHADDCKYVRLCGGGKDAGK